MDRFVFAASPFWADLHAAIVAPVLADLKTQAADAPRDEHDLKKGQWKGAQILWDRVTRLRDEWAREQESRRG